MLARVAGQFHHNLRSQVSWWAPCTMGTTINNSVLVRPQYVEMRVELSGRSRPFPEAAGPLPLVLHTIEHKAADSN